ncbi:11222_t:CDS:1, partial [Gigaspora margarita]
SGPGPLIPGPTQPVPDPTRSQSNREKVILKSPPKNKRIAYVTKNFSLPLSRFSPGNHLVEWRDKRESCLYCRYLMKNNDK